MPDSDHHRGGDGDGAAKVAGPTGHRTHPASALVRVWIWLVAAGVGWTRSIPNDDDPWDSTASMSNGVTTALIALGIGTAVGIAFGFATWWFTRYLIDDTQIRVDSGILVRRSRRAPYERLQSVDIAQPLAARIFGLAELRLEVAGGRDSRIKLQFLSHSQARALRRRLLDRARSAQGVRHRPAPSEPHAPEPAGATEGRLAWDRPEHVAIVTVPARRLVAGTLLSADFLLTAGIVAVLLVVSITLDVFAPMLPILLPFGGWAVRIVTRRVIAEWGFTLTRTAQGLRIERGLLSRSSQTVPFDRIQGIALEQPLLWHRLRWRRMVVDVAGYADSSREANVAPSVLLPVAPGGQVDRVVEMVVPGARPDETPRHAAPRRARWLAPIGWRFRAAGVSPVAFVTWTGWVVRCTSVVPHHKTQSVALWQSPLQRRLRLATVAVHTPDGPVNASGRSLGAGAARRLAFGQLERARDAAQAR